MQRKTDRRSVPPLCNRGHVTPDRKITRAMAKPSITPSSLGPKRRRLRIAETYLQGWVKGLQREAKSSGWKEIQLPGPYLAGLAGRQGWRGHPNAAGSGKQPHVYSSPGKALLPSVMGPSASTEWMLLDLEVQAPLCSSPIRFNQEMVQAQGKLCLRTSILISL